MPALERPPSLKRVTLPARAAVVAGECDVLVVGGGPAGLGAAWGAARQGASVILAERYGFLGGSATAALVTILASYHSSQPTKPVRGKATLFPTDHGPGEPALDGFVPLFVERLVKEGGALPPSIKTGYTVPFDPEIFKLVALEMLDEAGVQFLFHVFASGVTGKHKVDGVVFESKSGPVAVRARMVVDCTGDGDIAAAAGAPFAEGRDADGTIQPLTLLFRMLGYRQSEFSAYVSAHPDEWQGVFGLDALVRGAAAEGKLHLRRENILMFGTPYPDEVLVNSTRFTDMWGTDVWDLTLAEIYSRRQMKELVRFFREYVPGFRHSRLLESGAITAVRETRRITGDYILTADDVLTARRFLDGIARGTYPIDIHNPRGKGTVIQRLPPGKAYDIPLRCLIPKNTSNMLVAGRCISGTHEAHASYRVMPLCMATGQAAGVCAAVAAKKNIPPRSVDHREVQKILQQRTQDARR